MQKSSTLILLGAGPGDPELITLKGIKALKSAELVLFDALIDNSLLHYCNSACIKIYVGKRAGQHAYTQQQICALIMRASNEYKRIVRLKGGDSFVFGRAQEEIAAARSVGMSVEVIQGVSSALAVPGAAMIPLTARGTSESFWVITGTTRGGQLSRDINLAAQSTATVVLLMAINHLKEIMDLFIQYGRADTPVAIIQEGCTPRQKVIISQVDQIWEKATAAGLTNPAIIVVGDVVLSHQQLSKVILDSQTV